VQLWRLVRRAFSPTAADAFSGIGAEIGGGRWNESGTRAVYASFTQSLAVLEVLVHVDRNVAPDDYVFYSATIPDRLPQPALAPRNGWRTPTPSPLTVRMGQAFLDGNAGVAVEIPSVIVPREFNLLINPSHPDFDSIRIDAAETPFHFDDRLFAQ
jgi:RES domain-containing protein